MGWGLDVRWEGTMTLSHCMRQVQFPQQLVAPLLGDNAFKCGHTRPAPNPTTHISIPRGGLPWRILVRSLAIVYSYFVSVAIACDLRFFVARAAPSGVCR